MSETMKADNVLSITVLAAPSVLTFIKQETLRYDDQGLETGGILVGIWLDQDTCYLVGATGSGPMAEHAQYSFAVDTDYANNELNRIRQSFPGSDYVGEWHKHPATLERPSQGDLMTARQLLADPDYPIRLINPIMTVKNHQPNFHLFYLDRDLPDFVRLQEHGQIEAENDDEPWDDGSSIFHANIVLLAKNKQNQPTVQMPTPAIKPAQTRPPAQASMLEIPSPFTGEAGDVKIDTVKKYSKYFDNIPPARLSSTYTDGQTGEKSKEFFEQVPPARLSPNYRWNDGPVQPPTTPPNTNQNASKSPAPPPMTTGKLSGHPSLDDEDSTIAMGGKDPDKTVAMNSQSQPQAPAMRAPGPPPSVQLPQSNSQPRVDRPISQPLTGYLPNQPHSTPSKPKKAGISPALIMVVAGLILLLVILLLVLFLTR